VVATNGVEQPQRIHPLVGELTFDTVPDRWEESGSLFDDSAAVVVDLAGVTRADSAGLALLVGLVRRAKQSGKSLTFRNIPDKLLAIARVTGVETLLTGEQSAAQ
jgi:phospholipid transport system transporter-binding protein